MIAWLPLFAAHGNTLRSECSVLQHLFDRDLHGIAERREIVAALEHEDHGAVAIHEEDIAANYRMGELGAALLEGEGRGVLTHCNTGSLATGGYGTALGVIRSAFAAGKVARVFADETGPWLQGALPHRMGTGTG